MNQIVVVQEVLAQRRSEALGVPRFQADSIIDTGVVDQDVDRRLAADGSDDLVDSTMIGDIAGVKMEAVTRVARFDVKHMNGGPVIGELLHDRLSDSTGSARDDRYLIFQSHDQ
jgi:hypothetical protein